jgi:succinoglycan biosynthesis protein ExoA
MRDARASLHKERAIHASIVIPCRNEVSSIAGLLHFLLETGGRDCEVIVADGMSDDGTRDILRDLSMRHPRIVVVDNPKRSTSAGLNLAIRRASGEIIIRMDAHTRYAKDYVARCIEISNETGADNVGGPQLAEAQGFVASSIAVACHSPIAVGGSRIHDPAYEGPTDSVIYGVWRRGIFDRIGFFDEELARNQDGEFNRRIIAHGGSIWQTPRIRSWYRPRDDLRSVFRQYSQYGYWKVREIGKYRSAASMRHLVPAAFLGTAGALLIAGFLYEPAMPLFIALVACYLMFLIVSALPLCARERAWTRLPLIPLVFACMQIGYGYGFWRGVWDFWLARRAGRPAFEELTRHGE